MNAVDRLQSESWLRGDHPLGRGNVTPANVSFAHGRVELRVHVDLTGAEVKSAARPGHGLYIAHLRAAHAPGSLTAFFLYEDVEGGNDEIDIEIFNDGSRRALLSVWQRGDLVHQAEIVLDFDPAAGSHEYAIDHRPDRLTFLIDGDPVRSWTTQLPQRPMRVMVNAWWPTWLEPRGIDGVARLERIAW